MNMDDYETSEREEPTIHTIAQTIPQGVMFQMLSGFDIIEEIKMNLRGYAQVPGEQGKWLLVGKPLLNEDGVNKVASILTLYINRNTNMSVLEDEIITRQACDMEIELIGAFFERGDSYAIDPALMGAIAKSISFSCYAAMKRGVQLKGSGLGATMKMMTSTEQHKYTLQEEQKKRGLLPFGLGGK